MTERAGQVWEDLADGRELWLVLRSVGEERHGEWECLCLERGIVGVGHEHWFTGLSARRLA